MNSDGRRGAVVFKDASYGFTDCREGQGAYGGTWTENIVQAVSRDLLVEAMHRVERAGYHIVLTVHDEIITEMPKDAGDKEEFKRLMIETPQWADGLPMNTSPWCGARYRK
jgi:DNA polymerase bacteriophage-type